MDEEKNAQQPTAVPKPQTITMDSENQDLGIKKEKDSTTDAQLEERINKEIVFHEMPSYYRSGKHQKKTKTSKPASKIAGIFIMIFGIAIMAIAAYFLYSYLIKSPISSTNNQTANLEEANNQTGTQNQPEETKPVQTQENVNNNAQVAEEEQQQTEPAGVLENDTNLNQETNVLPNDNETEELPVVEVKKVVDNDGDGLTDKEEVIFGTLDSSKDTDADGYEDLSEILNLYNPAGSGSLLDNQNIKKYTNSSFNYTVLQPSSWNIRSVGGGYSVMFMSADSSMIQVVVQANAEGESITDWYRTQFPEISIEPSSVETGTNWTGVRSENGLILYLTDNNRGNIYVISYTSADPEIQEHRNVFEMMIKSFEVGI